MLMRHALRVVARYRCHEHRAARFTAWNTLTKCATQSLGRMINSKGDIQLFSLSTAELKEPKGAA